MDADKPIVPAMTADSGPLEAMDGTDTPVTQAPLPVTIPRELFDFLMGAGEIDGTGFGDLNANLPGRFWWRALLRTAESSSTASSVPDTGLDGVLIVDKEPAK